jgi:hypothetical protein
LYLSVLLGSPSITQDNFLLKILFVGRSGVTDPYRNQIENLILWIHCLALTFNMFVEFHILQMRAMDIFKAVWYVRKHWLLLYSTKYWLIQKITNWVPKPSSGQSFTFKGYVTRKIYCICLKFLAHNYHEETLNIIL